MIPLLDTHQHLIYPDRVSYGWVADIPDLAGKAFTLADYRKLTVGMGVGGSLFMETGVDDGQEVLETRMAGSLASSEESGILGFVATCRPEMNEGFDRLVDEAVGLGAVGFRRILHVVPDDLSRSETFRANVREIGSRCLTFDMCFLARQLPIALELARACADTQFILDHCGVPDIAGGGLDPWRAHMTALGELHNVYCKLSGILAYCAPGEAGPEDIGPYVDHVLEAFGPTRIVWGSDWPVVNKGGGLPHWIDLTRRILERLSADEARAIAWDNAVRVYDLKRSPPGFGC